MMCLGLVLAGTMSSIDAATQSRKVGGGTIHAFASYSGTKKKWSYNFGSELDNYSGVKAHGVSTYREYIDENELFIGGQLYKVNFNYNTTYLGTADFTFRR